ncbi:MAG: DNA replication and repair protein RecF [Thermoleophilia bacterium]|nr:DNA replication and repair protein RecF [Thermoleophilia bacterium]
MTTTARIASLQLHAIRSYPDLRLQLSSGVTVLVGPNGVGKTNLLEACAMVLSGSSPRTSSELRLVRHGEQAGRIAARIVVDDSEQDRDVVLRLGRGKQLRIDGSPAGGLEQFAAAVPVVTFLPERLLTIRGAPQRRRALLDQLAARLIPTAAATQRAYTAALQQRNALLRRAKGGARIDDQLPSWSQQLAEHGTRLREQRAALLAQLEEPFAHRFEQLTGLTGARFDVELRGSGDLVSDLAQTAQAELRRGSTLVGPHLDDLLPRIDGRDVRAFGSAGEQRAALLAYTLAASDLLATRLGLQPVVLLDEPWSELDADRRRRLSAILASLGQVIVTSTEPPSHLAELVPAATVLAVSSGAVTEWTSPATTHD